MSECVYDDGMDFKEPKRGERVEMVVEIYESADAVRGHGPDVQTEQTDTKRNLLTLHTDGDVTWRRRYRLTAVCVMLLLCIFLLTTITVLWIKFNTLSTENNQLQTSYINLTVERGQLQSSYINLTLERDQLKTSYNNLTVAREQLQRLSKLGWKFNFSSLYYVSTNKGNWEESRQDCRERGADLVIINSKEEQEFMKQLHYSQTWIGLKNQETQDAWTWVDDTPLTTAYWGYGKPGRYKKDCVVTTSYWSTTVDNWVDLSCETLANWICETNIF